MPKTKFVLVEVPEDWKCGPGCFFYADCTDNCPLSTAKEAVGPMYGHEISHSMIEYHIYKDYDLYAVKKDK